MTQKTMQVAKFNLGRVVSTQGARKVLVEASMRDSTDYIMEFILRHASGDWGEICEDDKHENEYALLHDNRLMSVYKTAKNETVWIITEADRSATTFLLPEEY